MKPYLSVLKLRFLNGLQYRIAAVAGVATQFFWGFIFIMIYRAFYQNAQEAPAFVLPQLVTYIWLQQAFLVFIMLWLRDNELFNLITSGNIAYELCRPCGIYHFWFAKLLAQRLVGAMLRCGPILLVAFCLPPPYRMGWPADELTLLLFLITLGLGVVVLVAISMFIYISVFYTMSPVGSMLLFSVTGEFLGGMVIPVPLMPDWLQWIVYRLPFRLAADLPFRIYSGNIAPHDALLGIGVQIFWLTILVGCGKFAMNRALRRVVVQGG